jgi:hypothetical protein
MRIYLAGPMFIESQIMYNRLLSRQMRRVGFEVYSPSENRSINDKKRGDITGRKIYDADIAEIERSNILVCQIADCPGTMWESGYMDCLSKNVDGKRYLGVLGISTDIRLETEPDPGKRGVYNQTMYLNQFIIGGLASSLGVCQTRGELIGRLCQIRSQYQA